MKRLDAYVLLIFALLCPAVYMDAFSIFIPGDNYSLFYVFEKEGLSGALHNLGPYLFSLPVVFFLYKLIGISSAGWIGVSIALHALNAFLVYLFAKKITSLLFKKEALLSAFLSGIIFLLSPYQTEAVVWTPADMILVISATLSLGSILCALNYFQSQNKLFIYGILIFFLLAVFSFEISWIVPGILLVLFIACQHTAKTTLWVKNITANILIPQAVILFLYFLSTKLLLGSWLWHTEDFQVAFSLPQLSGTLLKYFAKFIFFYRYLPLGTIDSLLRETLANSVAILAAFSVCAAFFVLVFFLFKRKSENVSSCALLLLCFVVSLLPVLPLDSSFLSNIYPDRYGYLPSVFFYTFLVLLATALLKKIAPFVLGAYAILCWVLLSQTLPTWSAADKYCNGLNENYKPFLHYDRTFVLNVPAYYKGVAAFRSALAETIFLKYNSPANKISVISGCYQMSPFDSVQVVQVNTHTLQVSGPLRKTPYFSTHGGWASSYETPEYSVEFDSTGCSYLLTFKQEIPKNSAFLYTANGTWKKAG